MAASALLAKPGKMMAGWLRVRRHSGSSFQHHQRFCVLMVEDGCTVFHVFTSDASLKSREFLKIEVRVRMCVCVCWLSVGACHSQEATLSCTHFSQYMQRQACQVKTVDRPGKHSFSLISPSYYARSFVEYSCDAPTKNECDRWVQVRRCTCVCVCVCVFLLSFAWQSSLVRFFLFCLPFVCVAIPAIFSFHF
jgi:hypothetical protein